MRTQLQLSNMLAQCVEDFACVQKAEHGFDLLDSRMKRTLRGLGISPDMWILPEGVKVRVARCDFYRYAV